MVARVIGPSWRAVRRIQRGWATRGQVAWFAGYLLTLLLLGALGVLALTSGDIVGVAVAAGCAVASAVLVTRPPSPVKRLTRPGWLGDLDAERRTFSPVAGPALSASWTPRVTVVVTAHNDQEYLPQALTSLQQQDFADFEVIVVDDASSDLTLDTALLFVEADARFRLLKHDDNCGLPAGRNTGLSHARGELVTFLDGDDFLYRSALSSRLAALTDEPACAGAFCDWRPVPQSAGPSGIKHSPRPLPRASLLTAGYEVPFIASAPLVRAQVMRELGGFREDLHSAEDFDMWMRLLRAGYHVEYAPYVGVAYRQVPGSMIRANPALHVEVVAGVHDWLDRELTAAEAVGPAPHTQPLSTSLPDAWSFNRQLGFLGLAAATGRAEQVDRVIAAMMPRLRVAELPADAAEVALRYTVKRLGWEGADHEDDRARLRADVLAALDDLRARGAGRARRPRTQSTRRVARLRPERVEVRSKSGEPTRVHLVHRTVERVAQLADPGVVLLPMSRYHVDELGPLHDALARRGIRSSFMLAPDVTSGLLHELAQYTDTALDWDEELATRPGVRGLVVLNDWAPVVRELVVAAQGAGVPTFGKVEGVQDFDDLDTGRPRLAYRTVDVVLGQGQNDVHSLTGVDVHVVGNSRLERVWHAPPTATPGQQAVVNYNFTWGVLTEHQDAWIDSVTTAMMAADQEFVVSLHPNQRLSRPLRNTTDRPMRFELLRSSLLVSRFSTVPFEAMARGVPFVYHNPHGERVPTFKAPRGAFLVTRSADELAAAVVECRGWVEGYRERAAEFFLAQVDVDPSASAADRAASVIADRLGHHRATRRQTRSR